ncbi:MAG TPA: PAS domain S-box protein [Desulfotignum sp.]|nr:PAS domain S-box protein [Desulfotignum sp.]
MPDNRPISPDKKSAGKIAGIYLTVSIVYILFSDRLLIWLVPEADLLTRLQTLKGWGFVLVTAFLMYYLLQKEIRLYLLARKELENSEEKYRGVINATPDLLYRTDLKGQVLFVSPSVRQLTGYSVSEALGMDMPEKVYAYPEEWSQFLKELHAHGMVQNFEARLKRKNNSIWWASTNAHFYKDVDGTIQGVEAITRDVTRKKISEKALLDSEQRMRAILEANPDPMVMYDLAGHPQYLNPAFTRVFGWTLPELKGKKIPFVPEDQAAVTAWKIARIMEQGRPLHFETQRFTRDGRCLDIHLSAAVIKDANGSPYGMVVNLRDISAKKLLEAQYEQAQKMESLGTLAGGIAHDFNNYLTGIFGYLDLAVTNTTDEKVTQYLSRILASSDRAKSLTRQLLTFSKGGVPVMADGHLAPFLQETVQFALSGASVSCEFDLAQDLWACCFDKNQISQVVDNIVINALHAMPGGGSIHISAENVCVKEQDLLALDPGRYVKIGISDTGVGIAPKYVNRIFDPFFSTKKAGTGLGLATSYSIIKRHGGMIDVVSQIEKGTTFHIFLPAIDRQPGKVFFREQKDFTGSGAVLIMDDEKLIRDMLAQMLHQMGFVVTATANGQDAVKQFAAARNTAAPFLAVILDLTIPGGMGGKQAAAHIRKLDHQVPVIVASGYSEDAAIAAPEAFGFTAAIEKPFLRADLATALSNCLNR